MLFNRWW